ncbi:Os06g0605900 [Oryza sativa Japonica Group]|uniref:Os06g0605900 protein n=2 Tax=Oryza sativa subsp. japonica TaxID=39947 RepID=Q69X07_ORYSJ|nr:hypothetical protein DAI22_06g208100 [Oryza sativa Japonica Group]BAD35544.1 putative F-box protein Fbl2 [Oryza sativa Japonica Group]BAG89384.1 unnamed protein product [Oryza sativa Japonica Group]BAS98525.1 Os06g0605900 [Oryza sativa Japonica Group]
MPPFHDYRDGGVLVMEPAASAALFGGVRSRKRARVTAVPPCGFVSAAAEAVEVVEEEGLTAAKRQKQQQQQREAPSLDALPDECLFEILRRVKGARARCASAAVSRRWLALLGGIRSSEIKREPAAAAVPDLNQVFVDEDEEEEDEFEVPLGGGCSSERCLEGREATDVGLMAVAVADALRGSLESLVIRGSHPTRGVTDAGISAAARGCPSLLSLALWHVPQGCPDLKVVTVEACPGVADEGLKAIGRCCAKLQSVNIKNCAHVGDQGVSGLVCSAAASLAKVRLQGLSITDASLSVIGYYGKAITDLTLARLPAVGERGFWVMANALGLQKLRFMSVSSCPGVTDLALASIAKFCPSLKQLNLKKCGQVSDGRLKDFAESAKVLESLQIEECNKVTLMGILAFLLNCSPKFKALSLVKCNGIKDICSAPAQLPLCKSLRSLTIKDCPGFTDASLAVVGMICPQLENVDLSGLGAVTDNGLLPLIKSSESGLVHVDLNGCENLTDATVSALVKAHGSSLARLSLEGCSRITDASLFAISEGCTDLAELDLSNCMVSDYGVAVLASARQLKLRVLSLSGCLKVTQKSVPFLGSMSASLEGLNLQFNFIGNHNIASLEKQLWWCDILA